jgi:K+-transporting ATPase ATPase C chain
MPTLSLEKIQMLNQLRPGLIVLLCLTVLTGGVYPLVITGFAQLLFPAKAAGSLLLKDGKPIGSSLIGQNFTDPKHFWSRPSAAGSYPYNGIASSGTNLGPLNPALSDAVKQRVADLRAADPGNVAPVPVDLATSSASGLDPHISLAAALYQADRVARARGLDPNKVHALVAAHTEASVLGFLGEPRVNVLLLNLALDESK